MEHLVITQFGTIKGEDYFEERSIESFLKMIEKNINNFEINIEDNHEFAIKYETKVYKRDENEYGFIIKTSTYETIYACLDIDDSWVYYPTLKSKLDQYTEITKKHDYEENVVWNYENNNESDKINDKKDINIYLKHLKKLREKNIIRTIKRLLSNIFSITNIPAGLILFIYSINLVSQNLNNTSALITSIFLVTSGVGFLANNLAYEKLSIKKILNMFKLNKLTKNKIIQLEKKLTKVNEINSKLDKEYMPTVSRDIYKDNIINYMNSIMNATNRLNNSDRHKILLELRNILDEYTANVDSLSIKTDNKLILEDSERKNMMDTIEKLTTLEMEISEIMKRDEKSKGVNSESTDLRNQINASLQMTEAIPSEKNQVRVRKI